MNKYFIELGDEGVVKYKTIEKHIKKLIDSNKIKDGEKLPSIRKLAEFLKVNNITIINTYKKLQSEGYAFQKMGSGTYAKRREINRNFRKEYSNVLKKISSNGCNEYLDFTGEMPNGDFFPVRSFKNVIDEVLERDGARALIYQEILGYSGLRESISSVFWNDRIDSDDILIVSGAQQGIDIISKAIINTNDSVVIEKPTYSGALSVFKWRRADIIDIPMDKDGIDIDRFEKILKKSNIKCYYTMSYFQNPTGISCSYEKKMKILNLAEIYDFYIIEDDYLSELIYDRNIKYNSYKSMDTNDRVIYIKSFSKIFLPGIRLGYLIPPKRFRESIQNCKVNTDIATSSLMQRALDLYIRKGFWREYINKLNFVYAKRYEYTKKCLFKYLKDKVVFEDPGGGLHFYIEILKSMPVDSIAIFKYAMKKNVLITPGTLFYKDPLKGSKYFRLSFSQVEEKDIDRGINIVADIVDYFG
ncbi:MAG: PLP-dependent aminotransferase family protein [Clostridium sp.]|uniref:MocR-like pyridoxine biosynthesis transcription factor PdxR n=1 Tax=Clostridium sp. TaxID=1506 RepID=UPI0025C360A2|nr:PLP-dependent aminotransferase family protein [Clostridium sp.]MCH3962875.1 PLP-dependent aminotransferase family protein [Clostridium sp.]MCI1715710.1 PLP-dependent aminotransferase family protein [Clostridium sp.]MCI1800085.1 PLP-dependent aminotransferase family protein [Clostridium sp.]MCI1813999.1 PLP-dependent aminotransferase family protein [Clostridium sp.]MCI1870897.1 PLP-dependent aminotransferase family protein [Clostridium sp.]